MAELIVELTPADIVHLMSVLQEDYNATYDQKSIELKTILGEILDGSHFEIAKGSRDGEGVGRGEG